MKVYLDLVILINFWLDFLILLSISVLLRRNIKLNRIILGALSGSISLLVMFISFNSFTLFFFKIFIANIMILISFGYKDIRYFIRNLLYLYMLSIILGGGIYLIKINYLNVISYNYYFLLGVISPIVLYLYVKQQKNIKYQYSNYYEVKITLDNNKSLNLIGYFDTGNNMLDPYLKRPILIISPNVLKNYKISKKILVPYTTINSSSMIECFIPKNISIKGIKYYSKVLIGISEKEFSIDGVNCLLNRKLLED